ncbi:MAG: thioesterase family protein, partial [Microthrixaceae bacterium]
MSEPTSLYVREGDYWLPTDLGRGPWEPGALHGGAVAPLLVRELELLAAPVPMRLARVTVELLRPVRLEPMTLDAEILRDGKKIGLLEATLRRAEDGTVVTRARALRMRVVDLAVVDPPDDPPPELPAEDSQITSRAVAGTYTAFHNSAVRHRYSRGMFGEVGDAFDWINLAVDVVPGERPTPWQRVAAAADFGNGISSIVPFDGSTMFINPDLTIHLWREPVGEWVGMDSVTHVSGTGIGLSDSALWDTDGRIGRTNQSLLFER